MGIWTGYEKPGKIAIPFHGRKYLTIHGDKVYEGNG
jgi:hypothetical protein